MTIKVAINGYGRIGRNVLRALYEYNRTDDIQIVAINDLGDAETNAHLTRRDTAHGRFDAEVKVEGDHMVVNGDRIRVLAERDPSKLPWGEMGVDVVMECTGLFASKEKSAAHLKAGARKVLISAPAGKDLPTIVYGVNHGILTEGDDIISNASCTTNCLAPVAKVLHEKFGIVSGLMTTVHSYTGDQRLLDAPHKDLRRARGAALSMIPTTTGAAKAVGLVLPDLDGKLNGLAIRVPTPNVSLVDLVVLLNTSVTADDVNKALRTASENELAGILGYSDKPLVSADFNGCPLSSIVDGEITYAIGTMVKVISWYDNETGYSERLIDLAEMMGRQM